MNDKDIHQRLPHLDDPAAARTCLPAGITATIQKRLDILLCDEDDLILVFVPEDM